MNTISVDQRFKSLATLGENTDWDSLTSEQVQVCMSSSAEMQSAGENYTKFVKNHYRVQVQLVDLFRDTGELTIEIPALPRPTLEELQKEYSSIKSIERDTSPVEPVTLTLSIVLLPWETNAISGVEYEHRIAAKHEVLLGFQQRRWLVENQDKFPEFMALLGKIYLDFPGIVVVHEDGVRSVPCAARRGERWVEHWGALQYDFFPYERVACARK